MLPGLIRTMRPHQWVKNLVVLAPLIFARELFDARMAVRAFGGFVMFCFLASSVYVLNDLVDVEADRQHPVKRKRPIASGQLSEAQARVSLGALVTVALGIGAALGISVLSAAVGYLVLQIAYSFRLKKVAYVDVLCIAAGFELRVLAGSFAAQVNASTYLLLVIFLAASFLGLGKRAHELAAMSERASGAAHSTRSVLRSYDPRLLARLLYLFGILTFATYVIYTLDPSTVHAFGTRWLVVSAVFAAFGLMRFIHLVRRRADAESPTDAMLRDPAFLVNLGAWGAAVVLIVYFT
jgi:decaprenyl-phosphate phosphoribosyltransferase